MAKFLRLSYCNNEILYTTLSMLRRLHGAVINLYIRECVQYVQVIRESNFIGGFGIIQGIKDALLLKYQRVDTK